MTNKRYSELERLSTFEERFRYLSLKGFVGDQTFGSKRFTNQSFYTSSEWRRARQFIIVRDNGCDLGIEGREIHDTIYIHHINPLVPDDIRFGRPCLIDPDNLISVTHRTHNAIHYGDESQLQKQFVERTAGDTNLW